MLVKRACLGSVTGGKSLSPEVLACRTETLSLHLPSREIRGSNKTSVVYLELLHMSGLFGCLLFVCLLLHYSETFNPDLPSLAPQSLLRTVNDVGRYFKVLVLQGQPLCFLGAG